MHRYWLEFLTSPRTSERLIRRLLSLPRELRQMILLEVIGFHPHDKFEIGAAYDLWRDWKDSYNVIRLTASRLGLMDARLAENVDFVEDNWKKAVEEMGKKKIPQLSQLGSEGLVGVLRFYDVKAHRIDMAYSRGRPDELLEMRGKEDIYAKIFEARNAVSKERNKRTQIVTLAC